MSHPVIRNYLRTAAGDDPAGPADADLLARFAASRDESAFELLVWRHAGLVQRVCRAVVRDHHAAEDAAQATFLILARKAHTFTGRGSVVGWLYRIARRVAVRLAKDRVRQLVNPVELDRVATAQPETTAASDEVAALCAEVDRLPTRYRIPILLCFFEGLTHAEAARRTGWAIGTVAGRLARAKDLLARRLSYKGVGVASVVLAVPAGSFVGNTAQAAVAFAARGVVDPGVAPSVSRLAEGVLKAMTTTKLKLAATAALVCLAATAWGLTPLNAPQPAVPPAPPEPPAAAQPAAPQPPAGERVADAKQRIRSKNNLKQIVFAFHSYYDANLHFPQNVVDRDGKPLLSWRVLLLPYLEQPELYKQFKLDEPWDSDVNKKLLEKMPEIYRVGFEPKKETRTYYQVFAGPGTPFEQGRKLRLLDVTDGMLYTLAVVETGPPVEWTRPADLPYDPKKPFPRIEKPFANVLTVGMLDGAAYSFRPDLEEKTLRHLIEHADGEVLPELKTLEAKLPITREEIESALTMLKQNEKLIDAIAGQLREQQKLLVELGKKRNLANPIQGIDLERLQRMNEDFEHGLAEITKETEELRKQIEKAEKK